MREQPIKILYAKDGWYVRIYASGESFLKDDKGFGIRYKASPNLQSAINYWKELGYTKEK